MKIKFYDVFGKLKEGIVCEDWPYQEGYTFVRNEPIYSDTCLVDEQIYIIPNRYIVGEVK